MSMTIGEAVKLIRLSHGDSLRRMAQEIQTTHVNLSQIERGAHLPSKFLCDSIQAVYGVCPFVLSRWTESHFNPDVYWRFLAENLTIRKMMIAEKEFSNRPGRGG